MSDKDERLKKYPKTEKFEAIDTIGVPHPYCITPKHVGYASDFCHGILGKEAIEGGEKHGAMCGICKGELPYSEHKTALLLEVDDKRELKNIPELKDYLMKIKPLLEKDEFAGVAFKQKKWLKNQ